GGGAGGARPWRGGGGGGMWGGGGREGSEETTSKAPAASGRQERWASRAARDEPIASTRSLPPRLISWRRSHSSAETPSKNRSPVRPRDPCSDVVISPALASACSTVSRGSVSPLVLNRVQICTISPRPFPTGPDARPALGTSRRPRSGSPAHRAARIRDHVGFVRVSVDSVNQMRLLIRGTTLQYGGGTKAPCRCDHRSFRIRAEAGRRLCNATSIPAFRIWSRNPRLGPSF